MKEISERLGPGIPKQPLMDSCVRAVNLGPGQHTSQPKRADGARCTCKTLGEGALRTETVTHKHYKHMCCIFMVRAAIWTVHLCKSAVFREAGPLSMSRCLLKQGEPKHNQTQVTKPGPLISVTALVPSTKGSSIGSIKWMVPHFMTLSICHSLSMLWPFSTAVKKKLFKTTEHFMIEASNLEQEWSLSELGFFKWPSCCIHFICNLRYKACFLSGTWT